MCRQSEVWPRSNISLSLKPDFPPQTFSPSSKHVPHPDLHFARVTEAGLDGAVEVEQQARGGGVAVVVRVEQVEDLDNGLQCAVAHRNGASQANVPREEPVILAQGVALDDVAILAYPIGREPPGIGRGPGGRPVVASAGGGGRLRRIEAQAIVH